MSREVVISKNVIIAYLGNCLKPDNIDNLFYIQSGNKEVLYEHIKALHSIFGKAKEDLENELKKTSINFIKE